MKARLDSWALLSLMISFVFVCGCLSMPESAESDSTVQMHLTDIEGMAVANNRFALDLYRELAGEDENVFFSPWSLNSALAMTYEGARGKTADEMHSVLHLSDNDSARRQAFSALDQRINANDSGYMLSTANAIWVDDDFSLLDGYETLVDSIYHARVTNLDFRHAPDDARRTINSWVKRKTEGKINEIVPSGYLNDVTRLVLTNAVYFNATWVREFEKSLSLNEDFYGSDGRVISVPTMRQYGEEAWFDYLETEDIQILKMPYYSEMLSMIILLPKENNLSHLEGSLFAENLDLWRRGLREQRVDIYIPRFKFNADYFLRDKLSNLGMPTAFSEMADFSEISPGRQLFISEVIHQAYVDVNEQGTVASAATAVFMAESAGPEEPDVPVFRADHPFIFLILDDETGCILFLGRVSDPIQG